MLFSKSGSESAPEKAGKLRLMLIVIGASAGIFLLLFGGNLTESHRRAPLPPPSKQEELSAYQAELEQKMAVLCNSVKGVASARVAVSLSGNFQINYATEQWDGKTKYVIVGSGANASALPVSTSVPDIIGIGVVCRGGGNAEVKETLTSLLSAAFDVPFNRISVVEAKS